MGKKRRAKFTPIIIEPGAEIKNYNAKETMYEIDKQLSDMFIQLENEWEEQKFSNLKSLEETAEKAIKTTLDKDFKNAKSFYKSLEIELNKKIDKKLLRQSLDDAYSQLNRAEDLAAKNTGLNTLKQWTTQFDSKVREWHDEVAGQKRKVEDFFTVPYPDGVDNLSGPKIPPISAANFINCRCFLQYRVVK